MKDSVVALVFQAKICRYQYEDEIRTGPICLDSQASPQNVMGVNDRN